MVAKEDNELVSEVIRGNVSAFEILVDRYQKIIFKMVLRMVGNNETAKDLTQDIFVKAFEKMGTFNFNFRFFSWIYRIGINETLTWIRRNPATDQLQEVENIPLEQYADPERKRVILEHGLQELSTDYRVLLLLKYYDGLTYEEISDINGLSVERVRSRLFIAREQLRKILLKKGFLEDE